MKHTEQLELEFNRKPMGVTLPRPQRRTSRASWWFAQMRAAVDRAVTWRPANPPRPRQEWLPV